MIDRDIDIDIDVDIDDIDINIRHYSFGLQAIYKVSLILQTLIILEALSPLSISCANSNLKRSFMFVF